VAHSEHNLDKKDPLRFIQMWINTRTRGLKPNYGSSATASAANTCPSRENAWYVQSAYHAKLLL
jgi:redox-sensitive bicupin YhaK (pirin superfamily)